MTTQPAAFNSVRQVQKATGIEKVRAVGGFHLAPAPERGGGHPRVPGWSSAPSQAPARQNLTRRPGGA